MINEIIKRIAVGIFIGGVSATLYAFISFYLMSALIRGNLYSIIFYCLQGMLLGFVYISLLIISERILVQFIQNHYVLSNQLIGAISGAISCLPSICLSWIGLRSSISQPDVYVLPEVVCNEFTGLSLFFLGSTLLGSLVGLGIGYLKRAQPVT